MNSLKMQMILMDRGINDLYRMRDYLAAGGSEQAIYQLFDTKLYFKDGIVPGVEGITDTIRNAWDWIVEKARRLITFILAIFSQKYKIRYKREYKLVDKVEEISDSFNNTHEKFDELNQKLSRACDKIPESSQDKYLSFDPLPILDFDAMSELISIINGDVVRSQIDPNFSVLKTVNNIKVSDITEHSRFFIKGTLALDKLCESMGNACDYTDKLIEQNEKNPDQHTVEIINGQLEYLNSFVEFCKSCFISSKTKRLWDDIETGVTNILKILEKA